MSWDVAFDEPIQLPSGKRLLTLRDAGEYIASLPAKTHNLPKWQTAMSVLLTVAEGGPTMFARIAMMQSIMPKIEPNYTRPTSDTHWGRGKLARDRA